MIFGLIEQAARQDGFSLLLDGTNASDEEETGPESGRCGSCLCVRPCGSAD